METAKTKTLGPRLAVGFGLGGVFLLSLLNPMLFVGLLSVATAAAGYELANVLKRGGWHVPKYLVGLAGLLLPWVAFFWGAIAQWLTVLAASAVMVIWRAIYLMARKESQTFKQTLRDFGASNWALFYVPLLLSFGALLINQPNGTAWVFGLVITVVSIDTVGYLIGRFFGKTKLSPLISPKKTWEGTLGGIILSAGLISLVANLLWKANYEGFVIALVCAIGGTIGDLAESRLKRLANVKDSGSFMPGHGGFLDRFDSILFAAPMVWLVCYFLYK